MSATVLTLFVCKASLAAKGFSPRNLAFVTRRRYATWNEIFLFDDIAVASAVGGGGCAAHSSLDGAGGGVDTTGKTSTHAFLGQLPTVEHMHVLHHDLKVECVVSCVEEFELKKYDLNFGAMGFDHCILPQARACVLLIFKSQKDA